MKHRLHFHHSTIVLLLFFISCDACTSVYIVNSVGCVTPSSLLIHVLKQIKLHFQLGIVTERAAKYRSISPGGEGGHCKGSIT